MTRTATRTRTARKAKDTKAKDKPLFQGRIDAIRVYTRRLPGFDKKRGNACPATCWLIVLPGSRTTSVNTYNQDQMPAASWNPAAYAGPLNQAKLDKKIKTQHYREVEVDEWPPFLTNAKRK